MTYKFQLLLVTLLFILPKNLISQEIHLSEANEELFDTYAAYIAPYKAEQMESILEKTAGFFLKTRYVAGTLDQNEDEKLVINLRGMDCVTYLENVLALSFAVHNHNLSKTAFVDNLRKMRYRNNEIVDYASRIHYTSDWIVENEKNNLITNISKELSDEKETKKIDFMSTHRGSYKQLADNDTLLNKIVKMEQSINSRGGFYYLPKQLIALNADKIPHMSIVAFVTNIHGLDTSHVGFAYHKDGKLTFIHASSAKQEVVIDDKTLSEYCLSQKNCKGIIVAKVNDTCK